MTDSTTPKKVKTKGILRWEAFTPTLIILALIYAYFFLFFDAHLRRAIEWGGYLATGAEVNVESLNTSFLNASLQIKKIEFTNAEKPTHNMFEIGEIRFSMLWDALLRGKIVINEAVIEQVAIDTQRKSPGKVKPPEPIDDSPSALEKKGEELAHKALEKTQEEYSENILGDIAAVLGGTSSDEQLKNIEGSIKSKARMKELEAAFAEKQKAWNEKLKSLPTGKDFTDLSDRLKAIKTKDFKSPQELQDSLKQADAIIKEADEKIKYVQKTSEELNNDVNTTQKDLKDLETLIQNDIKDLEKRFKLPKLDAKAIAMALLKREVSPYLSQLQKYQNLARKYLPPNILNKKSDPTDVQIQPRARASGISYEFGRPNSYPFFWLKKAALSSVANAENPYIGNLKGELTNVSSSQPLTGKPIAASLTGNFPALNISGIDVRLTVDHVRPPFKELFSAAIGAYPLEKKLFLSDNNAEVGFSKAQGKSAVEAKFQDDIFSIDLQNKYTNVDFIVSSPNKDLDTVLKDIFKEISFIDLNANGEGRFPNVPLSISSNLGPEIVKGLQKQIQAKIDEAREKIKKAVDEAVAKEKQKLEADLNKMKNQIDSEVKKVKAQADAAKKQAEKQVDDTKKQAESSAKKQAEDQVKKVLGNDADKKIEDLKKKFKF